MRLLCGRSGIPAAFANAAGCRVYCVWHAAMMANSVDFAKLGFGCRVRGALL